ncbi:hypothetical protein [Nocardiopsis synnemataformans]|uniref:hypothetical protein n=1 Tax=Nocardiopsis synnemataformans TaxID=61305 RepID=UPI003EBF1326
MSSNDALDEFHHEVAALEEELAIARFLHDFLEAHVSEDLPRTGLIGGYLADIRERTSDIHQRLTSLRADRPSSSQTTPHG